MIQTRNLPQISLEGLSDQGGPSYELQKAHLRSSDFLYSFYIRQLYFQQKIVLRFSLLVNIQYSRLIASKKNSLKISYGRVQYNLMRTQLVLPQAIERLYGKSLLDNSTPASEWHFYAPYATISSNKNLYFRLLELPASYHTSQEICANALQKYGDVLQKVQFLFVERTFQSCIYLIKAESNILTIRSLIQLRSESGEHVQEQLIFKFLEFVHLLEEHKYFRYFGFDLDQIGLDERGEFVLVNYELYFKQPQKETRNLNRDTRKVLESLIMLSQESFSLMDLYSRAQEIYGDTMMKLVEKCMKMEFKTSDAMTIIQSSRDTDERLSRATLTDSYISDMDRLEETLGDNSFSDGPSFTKVKKIRKTKKSLLLVFSILFIVLLSGIGYFAFNYLSPHPIVCGQAEFYDKELKKCLGCSFGCQRCENEKQDTCHSCKGDLYLVMANFSDRVGYCSANCKGLIVAPKTCIYNEV